jgi:hypothetical protein
MGSASSLAKPQVAKEYLGLGACVVKDQRCSVAADFVKDGGNGIASAAACPRRRRLGFKHRDVGVGAGIGMDDVAAAGCCREKVGDGSGVFYRCRKPDATQAGAQGIEARQAKHQLIATFRFSERVDFVDDHPPEAAKDVRGVRVAQ